MKRCIISWASNGREFYPEGLKRLIPSLINKGNHKGEGNAFLIFSPDINVDTVCGLKINKKVPSWLKMPSHEEVPYGFKPWLFKVAFDAGFEQVLWCDSTIVCHNDLTPAWNIATERGATLFDNPGCLEAIWTSDDCLQSMGCSPDLAKTFSQVMACAMIIDRTHAQGKALFDEWFNLCNDGVSFAGRSGSSRSEFRAHRHDQSCISYLAQKHNIKYIPYGMLTYHGHHVNYQENVFANTGLLQ